jgi:hypothetical protein
MPTGGYATASGLWHPQGFGGYCPEGHYCVAGSGSDEPSLSNKPADCGV